MYAVIESGGKQHRVETGESVRLEKLDAPEGESVTFDKVMMIGDGADMQIGTPLVEGGSVTAEVISHGRGDKIRIIKIKRRKHSRKQANHRQWFTEVRIKEITQVSPVAHRKVSPVAHRKASPVANTKGQSCGT